VSGQLHAPFALPPGKSPRYPFYRRLGGPQSRSGRYGEGNIFDPTGTRNYCPSGRPARSQLLYRLQLNTIPFKIIPLHSTVPLPPPFPLLEELFYGWRNSSSGIWRRVVVVGTDVSEERIASIFRAGESRREYSEKVAATYMDVCGITFKYCHIINVAFTVWNLPFRVILSLGNRKKSGGER
jgi:hypothetical protein